MTKIKQFLKAKKGKELVEIIILIPVMIFLIFYSAINIVCYIAKGKAEDITTSYARCAVTERTYYDALCSVADELEISGGNVTVIEIMVTSSDGSLTNSMTFSDNEDETTYFKNLISKDRDGNTTFNLNVSEAFKRKSEEMSTLWKKGNYITIKTMQGLTPTINSISKISIYNFSTHQEENFDYGVSGTINCKVTSLIIA